MALHPYEVANIEKLKKLKVSQEQSFDLAFYVPADISNSYLHEFLASHRDSSSDWSGEPNMETKSSLTWNH